MMPPSTIPPIFVINLAADVERRRYMEKQLKKLPVCYEWVDAVRADHLSAQELTQVLRSKARIYTGRALKREEIACYLSHLKAMRKICDRNIPQAIIMEDDVLISEDIVPFFENQDRFPNDWSIVQLGHSGLHAPLRWYYRGIRSVCRNYHIGRPFPLSYGTQGYLAKREFCSYFLENASPICVPIDHRLFDVFVSAESFYALTGKQIFTHKCNMFTGKIGHAESVAVHRKKPDFMFRVRRAGSLVIRPLCRLLVSVSNPSSRYKDPIPILYIRRLQGRSQMLLLLKFVCTNMLYSSFVRRLGLFGKFPRAL